MQERSDLFGELSEFVGPDMFAAALRTDKPAPAKQRWTIKIYIHFNLLFYLK
jgi:hypothetical protein